MRRLALLLLLSSCAERIPGLQVTSSITLTQTVALDTATISLEELWLVPCVQQAWWSPVSTAWAHGAELHDDPRLVHKAMLIDLTRAEVQPLATWAPPPGEICQVKFGFRPSTADVVSFGTTTYLEGPGFRRLNTEARDVIVDLEPSMPNFQLQIEATPPPAGADAASTFEQFISSLTVKVTP
ncbi:MAG: hypothetical protein ACO1OB_23405 [Archangium sp.]